MKALIERELVESAGVLASMCADAALHDTIAAIAERCIACLRGGGKILFAGNGGSAADSQHLAGELVSRFRYDRPGLPAIALTVDTSVLTAIGNDYGYDRVFARQIEALGRRGDMLIALSTSGRSLNILAACEASRACGVATIGFTGQGGGALVALCDLCLRIPSAVTPKIQEGHIIAGHIVCDLIEQAMFPRGG